MFELFLDIRKVRKAFKKAAALRAAAATAAALREELITSQSAAYGFEVAKNGGKLLMELPVSPDNPFRDPTWRERVY